MSEIKIHICDRCGNEIDRSKTISRYNKPIIKKFKLLRLFNGNQSGYDYTEQNYELCDKCTELLINFLNNKE